MCYSPRGSKQSDTTEQLNNNSKNLRNPIDFNCQRLTFFSSPLNPHGQQSLAGCSLWRTQRVRQDRLSTDLTCVTTTSELKSKKVKSHWWVLEQGNTAEKQKWTRAAQWCFGPEAWAGWAQAPATGMMAWSSVTGEGGLTGPSVGQEVRAGLTA